LQRRVDALEGRHGDGRRHGRNDDPGVVLERAQRANREYYADLDSGEYILAFGQGFAEGIPKAQRESRQFYPGTRARIPDSPPFRIEDGRVFSSRDGKPITDPHWVTCEVWYWEEYDTGNLRLRHNAEREAFYAPDGNLALSRESVNICYLFKGLHAERKRTWGEGSR
jgi:hypothetical protein